MKHMIKLVTLLLLALACGGEAINPDLDCASGVCEEQQLATLEQPLPGPLVFGFRSHAEATQTQVNNAAWATNCAVNRWKAAAAVNGLNFSSSMGTGASHYIEPRNSGSMGGRTGWTIGTWANTTTRVLNTMSKEDMCDTIVHEIGCHTMRQANNEGHIDDPPNNAFDSAMNYADPVYIYATNVSLVCLSQSCAGTGVPEHY